MAEVLGDNALYEVIAVLEREMEDLIAANPEHFFPRHGFVLQGRQQSFRGVGRFDLLFTDRHGMDILMELKAVPARYDVIDQIARYRDALVGLGATNLIMWIVAPSIPVGMKEFLAHLGIEYTEIHETEFARVAALVGYSVRTQVSPDVPKASITTSEVDPSGAILAHPSVSKQTKTNATREGGTNEWGFGNGTQPSFLIRALEAGGKTKEQIRSDYINHFHPELTYSEAKNISGFGVFFSDSKRPVGTYHASRSLLIRADSEGRLASMKRGLRS